jgi:copper chaperone CopZ
MRIMDNVVRVGVNGMTCADCKKQVESELGQLRDNPKYKSRIKEIAVDLKGKTATIRMIETVKLSAQERDELTKDVADAITKAGYEPVLMAPRPNRM